MLSTRPHLTLLNLAWPHMTPFGISWPHLSRLDPNCPHLTHLDPLDLTLHMALADPFTQHFSQNLNKYLNQPLAKPVTQPSLSLTIPLTHPTQPFTHPDTNPLITLPTWLQLMLLNLNLDWGGLEAMRRILKLNSNTKSESVFRESMNLLWLLYASSY